LAFNSHDIDYKLNELMKKVSKIVHIFMFLLL